MGWIANMFFNQKEFEAKCEAHEMYSALRWKQLQLNSEGCTHIFPFLENPTIENIKNYQCPWCLKKKTERELRKPKYLYLKDLY